MVATSATTLMPEPSSVSSTRTFTFDSISGWHIGIRSEVRFAAITPAISAVARTSPLPPFDRASSSASRLITTRPAAVATPLGRRLVRDIDHPRPPVGVDMGELVRPCLFLAIASLFCTHANAPSCSPEGQPMIRMATVEQALALIAEHGHAARHGGRDRARSPTPKAAASPNP